MIRDIFPGMSANIILDMRTWTVAETTDAATGYDVEAYVQCIALGYIRWIADEAYKDSQYALELRDDLEYAQDALNGRYWSVPRRDHPFISAMLEAALESIDNALQTTRYDPYYNVDQDEDE